MMLLSIITLLYAFQIVQNKYAKMPGESLTMRFQKASDSLTSN
jgi:hypothetical protein